MSWQHKALIWSALCTLIWMSGCGTSSTNALKINELFSKSSQKGVDDWLEIYNPSEQPVSLKDLQLKDVKANIAWTFPAETTIPAKGFLVVVCDDSGTNGRPNFKLSSKGETIQLQNKSGEIIDKVTYPTQKEDTSWARKQDGSGEWGVSSNPTPGKSNS